MLHRRHALIALAMLIAATLACNAQFNTGAPTPTPESSVVFVAPDNQSIVADGSQIVLAVNVKDSGGVAKVEFTVDDSSIGIQTPPTPMPDLTAQQPWKASGIQGHLITAVAYRTDGTPIGDAKITVQVVALATATQAATQAPTQPAASPTVPPTVAPTNPPAGATTPPPAADNQPRLQVTAPNLNIRAGPGTNFPIIGSMKTDDSAAIVGRNGDSSWLVVQKDQTRGWVINSQQFSQVVGDIANLPLVQSPPTPVPTAVPATPVPPTGAPTSTTGAVADLVFGNVTLNPGTPTANQTFNVSIEIRNQGTVDAGNSFLVGVFQPGNETSPVAVPPIKAGQTITVNMPVTLKSGGANQSAVLTLDKNSEINEGPNGEANNTKTITYNVNP
jgi:hypothetical protein